jgi:hypothetical protein
MGYTAKGAAAHPMRGDESYLDEEEEESAKESKPAPDVQEKVVWNEKRCGRHPHEQQKLDAAQSEPKGWVEE